MQSTQCADVRKGGRNWRLAALAGSVALLAVLFVGGGAAQLQPRTAVAAGGWSEMSLDIIPGSGGYCLGSACTAEAGGTFTLRVTIHVAPSFPYVLVQAFLNFGVWDPSANEDGAGPGTCGDGLENVPDDQSDGWDRMDDECVIVDLSYVLDPDPTNNIVWPDVNAFFTFIQEVDPGTLLLGGVSGGGLPPVPSTYAGSFVELRMTCPAAPVLTSLALLPEGDPLARTNGALFVADSTTRETPKVDAITIDCIAYPGDSEDTDGDGCANGTERGSDPLLGGDRDWLNPWDFYDVAIAGGLPGQDGVIDLPNDILGVISRQGSAPGPPYDVQYDRGPATGPSWNGTAPPDGVIDLPNDILGVIAQFGASCA